MTPHLILIDGSGFIHRAFHAYPPLVREDGANVGAVYGYCRMLHKLLRGAEGHGVMVAFDPRGNTWRHDIYPKYKATRKGKPDALGEQFGLAKAATKAFGVVGVEVSGFEADDVIATYATTGRRGGSFVTIVSQDKDFMQLIGPGIEILNPVNNTKIGTPQVRAKFGVAPHRVVDVQALAGDTADNVPGVPGIGVKTAAALVNEFGSLEAVLERASEVRQPARRKALLKHADMAQMSAQLVGLLTEAPMPVAIADMEYVPPTARQLREFLMANDFVSLIDEFRLKEEG